MPMVPSTNCIAPIASTMANFFTKEITWMSFRNFVNKKWLKADIPDLLPGCLHAAWNDWIDGKINKVLKNKKNLFFFIGGFLLLIQLFYFRDYLLPMQWGQVKVSGLACTCPDETVVSGRFYLRTITPDSLKKYDLDYSEIYVTEKPYTDIDPMGVDLYLIKGQVIGKKRVSEGDPWNPVVQITSWRELDILKDYAVKGLFFLQLFIFAIIIYTTRNKKAL